MFWDRKLATIEMYSAADNTWTQTTSIPSGARLGIAAAVVSDALILVGGFDKDHPNETQISTVVERFNILTNKYNTAAFFRKKRFRFFNFNFLVLLFL